VAVALERSGDARGHGRSDAAIRRALGDASPITRRPDGKPQVHGSGREVSVAHAGSLTLAVAGVAPLGCDLEPVAHRSEKAWLGLLGPGRWDLAQFAAQSAGEDLDTAATRVWAAGECLKKAGAATGAPLVLASSAPDGWVVLQSGDMLSATYAGPVRGFEGGLVLSVLAGSTSAS
jgi:enediyne polyketide synthase